MATEMNQDAIYKMFAASPVGKSMSAADLDAMRQMLETTPVTQIGGWYGEQIRKAARLAKGDYVGHPFRGNQYTDASGVGRGSSSGPSSRRSTAEIDAINERLARTGDKQLMMDGLLSSARADVDAAMRAGKNNVPLIDGLALLETANRAGVNTPEGKQALQRAFDWLENENYHGLAEGVHNIMQARGPKNGYMEFERDAKDFVSSQIAETALFAETDLKRQMDGIDGIIETSKGAIDNADVKAERSENFESEDAAKDRKDASDVTRAETRLQRHAKEVKSVLESLIVYSRNGRTDSNAGDIERAYKNLFSKASQLQMLRSEIMRDSEFERTASRQGFAGGKSVTGKYGLLLGSIRQALEAINEVQSEVDSSSESIRQSAEQMYADSKG
jgi:hypothetical protein